MNKKKKKKKTSAFLIIVGNLILYLIYPNISDKFVMVSFLVQREYTVQYFIYVSRFCFQKACMHRYTTINVLKCLFCSLSFGITTILNLSLDYENEKNSISTNFLVYIYLFYY
jgi:hypothetical protein